MDEFLTNYWWRKRSIQKRIIRGFGKDAVERGESAEQCRPQAAVVIMAQQVRGSCDRDPRMLPQFVFELACAPARVADKRPHDTAGPVGVDGGLFGGNAQCPVEAAFLGPPERAKRELIVRDRSACMYGEVPQRCEFLVLQEIPDPFVGWMIEDQPERALVGRVIGQQDHRAVENAVPQ